MMIYCAKCNLSSGECKCPEPKFVMDFTPHESLVIRQEETQAPRLAIQVHVMLNIDFFEPAKSGEEVIQRSMIVQGIQQEIDNFVSYLKSKYNFNE